MAARGIEQEQLLESRIGQLHVAPPIEDDDSQRAIVNKRIQVAGALVKLHSNPQAFGDGGAYDQADGGDHQHEIAYFAKQGGRRGNVHRHHDAEIQGEQSGRHPADSLAHGNPDHGNEAQIEELKRRPSGSEDKKGHKQCSAGLADPFQHSVDAEWLVRGELQRGRVPIPPAE